MPRNIIIICGPTGVGKTAVGIELAKRFDGEIVSADSGQVWRGFDIGTAKPSLVARRSSLANTEAGSRKQEAGSRKHDQTSLSWFMPHASCIEPHASCFMPPASDRFEQRAMGGEKAILHHLIDVADPDERFDAARFVGLADAAIEDISGRGRTPFIVGGTGMYIRMLVHGICEAPPRDGDFRKEIEAEIDKSGVAALHERLKKIDPETAGELHPNDRTRIIRALEIHFLAGVPASQIRKEHKFRERRYDALKIGLLSDRAELYRRIGERVDTMIARGLVDEVKGLLARYNENCQPFSAVGYREIVDYLKGRISFAEAVRLVKRNSRRYAKRQMTWFRADSEIEWFAPEEIEKMALLVARFSKQEA